MTGQPESRYLPNELPDYDAFVSSLPAGSQPTGEGGEVQVGPFSSSMEYARLAGSVRSWLLQNVQLVEKTWPASSSRSPTSIRGQSEQDYSIYVGAGEGVM